MQYPGPASAVITRDRASWERPGDWPGCILYGPHLARTLTTALVVGTILFCINHLDGVLHGHAGTGVWIATGISYVVPFCVANAGMLAGTRRGPGHAGGVDKTQGGGADPAPTWSRLSELPRCVLHPPYLARTLATAVLVGTVYFAVNQLGTVLRGDASTAVWEASGFTYLVPFCVSNMGLLVARRRLVR